MKYNLILIVLEFAVHAYAHTHNKYHQTS